MCILYFIMNIAFHMQWNTLFLIKFLNPIRNHPNEKLFRSPNKGKVSPRTETQLSVLWENRAVCLVHLDQEVNYVSAFIEISSLKLIRSKQSISRSIRRRQHEN